LNIIIEPAELEDAAAIVEVQRATWLDTYPNKAAGLSYENIRRRVEGENGERIAERVEKWRHRIISQKDDPHAFVARIDGEVVGIVFPSVIDGQPRVGSLYVLPSAQGKGIGGQLLREVFKWFGDKTDIYLRVAAYNENAIKFYQKYGFEFTNHEVIDDGNVIDGKQIPEREMVRKSVS
jgi:ribosomal protein S18 acetylase RimI-like enzyme